MFLLTPACGDSNKNKDEKAEKDDDKDKDKDKKDKKDKDKDKDKGKPSKSAQSSTAAADSAAVAPPPAPTEAPKPPLSKDQLAAFMKDENAKMTSDAYESLLLGVADCRLESGGIDYKCQAYKDYSDAQSKHKLDDYKIPGTISMKHLRHPSASVRYVAVSGASGATMGMDGDAAFVKFLDAAKAETDPYVTVRFLSSLRWIRDVKPDLEAYVVAKLDDKEPRVREEAARFLGDTNLGPKIAGAYEKLAAKAESDSDNGVRSVACQGLFSTSNDAAIALFEKLLVKDSPEEVRWGCFEGLIRSWAGGYPFPKKPSKAGYELTMKILEATPRTEEMPPSSVSGLGAAKSEQKSSDGKAWYDAVKDFLDKDRLVKAVSAVAMDEKASYSTRSSCLYVLKRLGEQKKLEEMAPLLTKQGGTWGKSLGENAEKLSKDKSDY
ncbi:MAG: HEAT repeat domain-containing protein [Polyangiaceae bacterium]